MLQKGYSRGCPSASDEGTFNGDNKPWMLRLHEGNKDYQFAGKICDSSGMTSLSISFLVISRFTKSCPSSHCIA